jgi:protocatechuate 3,4-dioxygenase beta subunit
MIRFIILTLFISTISCRNINSKQENTETKILQNVDACDGCELMYDDMPDYIDNTDTSCAWNKTDKLLIKGRILDTSGQKPLSNVILYYWHTNDKGIYSDGKNNHGAIRGWVKTNEDGKYYIYTAKPAPYPDGGIPAHIHILIKEPQLQKEYYIDDIVFDNDTLLSTEYKTNMQNRGGSGIVRLLKSGDIAIGEHDIIAGFHIPDHPKYKH